MNHWSAAGVGTASYLEIIWTSVAFVMTLIGAYTIRCSMGDLLLLHRNMINSLIEAVAWDNLLTAIIRTGTQVAFFAIGILHMLVPPRAGEYAEIVRVGLALSILFIQLLIILAIASAIYTRKYLITEIKKG